MVKKRLFSINFSNCPLGLFFFVGADVGVVNMCCMWQLNASNTQQKESKMLLQQQQQKQQH